MHPCTVEAIEANCNSATRELGGQIAGTQLAVDDPHTQLSCKQTLSLQQRNLPAAQPDDNLDVPLRYPFCCVSTAEYQCFVLCGMCCVPKLILC
jgi:hypothetical protein